MGEIEPFTAYQKLAMIGIIIFMLPLLFMIVSNLGRGMLILFSFIFQALHFPTIVTTFLIYIVITCAFTFTLCVTYYLCELLWPKRVYKNGS